MNAIVLKPQLAGDGGVASRVWRAWTGLQRRHWVYALLAAAVYAATNLLSTLDYSEMRKVVDVKLFVLAAAGPVLTAIIMLLAWAIADAGNDARMPRWGRVAIAMAIGTFLGCTLVYGLYVGSGVMADLKAEMIAKGRPVSPAYLVILGDWVTTLVSFGLFIAFGEMTLARERIEAQARTVMREQAKVAREVLESRLAAMQAQVEPQFLFDSLVDVRALYERAPAVGSATLDRLITYLRVALPRLRESGSSVGAEVELVRAYLSVVAARHDGRPRFEEAVSAEATDARFYPMLLLPLVQRAVRESADTPARLPERVELTVRRAGAHLVALLRFDAPGLCSEDADLARVRQRLTGLYRGDAALKCSEASPGQTEFMLTVPYEPAGPPQGRIAEGAARG